MSYFQDSLPRRKTRLGLRLFQLLVLPLLALLAIPTLAEQPATEKFRFRQALPSLKLEFPRDHGSHPEYETEWWYYTGHLYLPGKTAFKDDPDYGFQLTFFRRRSAPAAATAPSAWDQSYLAHVALADFNKRTFRYEKRLARGALGLAGAREADLDVWQRDWRAEAVGDQQLLRFSLPSSTTTKSADTNNETERTLQLTLLATPSGAPLLHGENGYSRKGGCPSCASHYYSLPALTLSGHLQKLDHNTLSDKQLLTGIGWMDHEFMSSALEPQQQGWDWLSLLLPSGKQLMLFRIRHKNGSVDFASGTLRDGDRVIALSEQDFVFEPIRETSLGLVNTWKSPSSGAEYPLRWKLKLPAQGFETELQARLPDQELSASEGSDAISYWEGSVAGSGGELGYLEMTGYADSMGGVL
jgi:predicted secreted hydrolase